MVDIYKDAWQATQTVQGTENKKLAELIHAKIMTDIQEGRYFETAKAKKVTFSEMVEKYLPKYQLTGWQKIL